MRRPWAPLFLVPSLALVSCSSVSGSPSSTTTTTTTPVTVAYAARVDIATGFKDLTGLAVADFNGDGKLDIAVTDSYGMRLVVYLNNGSGGFSGTTVTTLPITSTTGTILTGDFNEDGRQDLLVGTISGGSQEILLAKGNGDGTFTMGAVLPGSFGMFSGVAIDLNHDGHLDLFAGGNGMLYVYLGDGKGNFTAQPFTNQGVSDSYLAVDAADYNGDGNVDLVAAGASQKSVHLYAGTGTGTFAGPVTIPFLPVVVQSMASGDFNGDGKRDLALGVSSVADVLLGNGDGTFQSTSYTLAPGSGVQTAQAAPIVAAADLNADGTIDLISADNATGTLNVYLRQVGGTFHPGTPDVSAALPNGSAAVKAADLNGDGFADIVVTNYTTGNISIFLSKR